MKSSTLPISAVIITKNEAATIRRCIVAVQQVVREVVIIDANSSDKTVDIANGLGARVVRKDWIGYGPNKNYGNQLATYDWILSIDADEVLSEELIQSLQRVALKEEQVFAMNRLVNYEGQWMYHSGWHPDWKVRLFNRKIAKWDEDALVHETLRWKVNAKRIFLEGYLYHYSYTNSEDHWERIERYAQLAAQQMLEQQKKASFMKMYGSPIARFFKTLLLKRAFLDGRLGWRVSWRNAYLVYRKYYLLKMMSDE